MMTNIALILTGGTICSFADQQTAERDTDASAAKTILETHYRQTHPQEQITFTSFTPYDILSENLTPQHWTKLLSLLHSLPYEKFDGIILAHGTDTLAYTAGMLAAAIEYPSLPIILVSANAPLSETVSNGHDNFAEAVRMIESHIPAGIWAIYRNHDGFSYLHRGEHLRQCENFSEDFFSTNMLQTTSISEFEIACKSQAAPPALEFTDSVLLLAPYVGLRYDTIALNGIQAVILGAYHSQTANALSDSPYSVLTLLNRCQAQHVFCGIAPCNREKQTYASCGNLIRSGLFALGEMPTSFAYAAAHVAIAKGIRENAIGDFILKRFHP